MNFSDLRKYIGSSEISFLFILSVYNTLMIILTLICCFQTSFAYLYIAASYFIRITQSLAVSFIFYAFTNLKFIYNTQIDSSIEMGLMLYYSITTFICILFVLFYTFFEIRPFYKGNILWCYENYKQFYFCIFNIGKSLIICFDGSSTIFLVICLIIHVHFLIMPKNYFN